LFGLDGFPILVEEFFFSFLRWILHGDFIPLLAGVAYNLFIRYKVYYTE
jgi:hypothetical protein